MFCHLKIKFGRGAQRYCVGLKYLLGMWRDMNMWFTFAPAFCQVIILNFFSMHSGTVKFFNSTKGFGFIVDSSTKEEIFVHVSGLVDEIRDGDTVTFETTRGKKGMNAVNVRLA